MKKKLFREKYYGQPIVEEVKEVTAGVAKDDEKLVNEVLVNSLAANKELVADAANDDDYTYDYGDADYANASNDADASNNADYTYND